MRKARPLIAALVLTALAGGGLVTAQEKDTDTAKEKEHGGHGLTAALTGPAEVPGPGDPDGGGTALITLNQGQNQVCFELAVTNIAAATAAHIHSGEAGKAGPPVVTLEPLSNSGASKGCVSTTADQIKGIRQNPAGFYVNVHNAEFPGGAVRGQLAR
jgi:hypothetical protein